MPQEFINIFNFDKSFLALTEIKKEIKEINKLENSSS